MGRRKRAKNAIAPHEQEGSRAPAAGQPPEQTSVGSGAEGSCQAPDVLARAGGWFKAACLKLAAVSNSAVDSLAAGDSGARPYEALQRHQSVSKPATCYP